mmetsp:Transcript_20957/g.37734  ORF Transcript_20957/g.37734 Transcript_20957/m.37734 type:complete len:205 (-) Transcript_20957:591-1205(-)
MTMWLITSLAFSTFSVLPASVTLYFFPGGEVFGVSGMLTSTPSSCFMALMVAPCLPMRSGKLLGWTATYSSLKLSKAMAVYPFSMSSLMALSATATASGGPIMVKTSPDVSMRATPLFSWMSLIVEPFGPITIPIFASGTLMVAVLRLLSFAFSSLACASIAALAAAPAAAAFLRTAFTSAWLSFGGAIPGMCWSAGPMPGTYF